LFAETGQDSSPAKATFAEATLTKFPASRETPNTAPLARQIRIEPRLFRTAFARRGSFFVDRGLPVVGAAEFDSRFDQAVQERRSRDRGGITRRGAVLFVPWLLALGGIAGGRWLAVGTRGLSRLLGGIGLPLGGDHRLRLRRGAFTVG
jgi:hypothetical protein